jgi:hypothetical protein
VSGHRHSAGHEHEFEPQYGLPQSLPQIERLLWQGTPQRRSVALEIFHVRAVAIYFSVLVLIRALFAWQDTGSWVLAVGSASWVTVVFALALALLWFLAGLVARTTVYTITDRRVVMRIGMVLTVTFNLPYARIQAAQIRRRRDGGGDIVLKLHGEDKIAWLHLWPHVRPWRLAHPEPMLRGLARVDEPARLLAQAWQAYQPQGVAVQIDLPAGSTVPESRIDRPVHDVQGLRPAGAAAQTVDSHDFDAARMRGAASA